MAAEESAGIRPREETTREGILRLIMERGPISAAELAQLAILTPAGVRRHLVALEDAGAITECEKPGQREARAGRPARYYVATDTGQNAGATSYHTMANAALDFLRENLGEAGVEEFARRRERSWWRVTAMRSGIPKIPRSGCAAWRAPSPKMATPRRFAMFRARRMGRAR